MGKLAAVLTMTVLICGASSIPTRQKREPQNMLMAPNFSYNTWQVSWGDNPMGMTPIQKRSVYSCIRRGDSSFMSVTCGTNNQMPETAFPVLNGSPPELEHRRFKRQSAASAAAAASAGMMGASAAASAAAAGGYGGYGGYPYSPYMGGMMGYPYFG